MFFRTISLHFWEDIEEKNLAPGGIRTHDLSIMRRVLYRCATTAACRAHMEHVLFGKTDL